MFELRRSVNGRALLVGHRGAMAVAPENTMPAFEAGVAGGADILELDVQLTSDGEVAVFHDVTLENKAGAPGMMRDYTAVDLQQFDVGPAFDPQLTGVRIPLLADVLAWAKGRTPLMIEMKHGPIFNPALDAATVALIEKYDMVDEVVIISFDQFSLRRIKQRNPRLTTSFIYVGRLLDPLAQVGNLPLDGLSPATDFLTQEEVALIHDAGYICTPGGFWWDYPQLVSWGVDTVSSNDPASVTPEILTTPIAGGSA